MSTISFQKYKHLDHAYHAFSPLLQALDLLHGKADVISILARNHLPKGTSLSPDEVYPLVIKQFAPLLAKNLALNNKLSLMFIDPSCPQAFKWEKSAYIAIRCLFQNSQGSISPRVFLFAPSTFCNKEKIYQFFLGNIDLFVFHPNCFTSQEFKEVQIHKSTTYSIIQPSIWLEVSRHLDGGQRLNLSELGSLDSQYHLTNPFKQHYHQLSQYMAKCPNGHLARRPLAEKFFVVHQSAYKTDILASGELRMSRGGCIGNLVYTTELVGAKALNLGGHALGLLERKSVASSEYRDHLILAQVEKTGNNLTNWIDKFGRGMLICSARQQLLCELSSKRFLQIDRRVQSLTIQEYAKIFPVLQLSLFLAQFVKEHSGLSDHMVRQGFSTFAKLQASLSATSRSSLFNGIYFEIIKDYILFFQNDPDSIECRSIGSFNMGIQYRIFFELCPALKANWDTTQFNPTLETLHTKLKEYGLLTVEEDVLAFHKFFLERLAYYINYSLLEGSTSTADFSSIHHFEDLNAQVPNLACLLYYYSLKSCFRNSLFFKTFSDKMRAEYQRFYQERDIDIAIKCGLARTEEIGLSKTCHVAFLDFELESKSKNVAVVLPTKPLPFLIIQGVSQTNGFTFRPSTAL